MTDSLTCGTGYHVECICVADTPPVPSWRDHGVIPHITESPTEIARRVALLMPYDGIIWVGYGDFNDTRQLGCELAGYSLATDQWWEAGHVATDALYSLRVIEGDLWAPVTDPEIGADPDVAIVHDDETMSVVSGGTSMYPWHLFDVAEFAGTVFVAGALRTQLAADGVSERSWACVWRRWYRADGREMWQPIVISKAFIRCYSLFELDGYLWAFCGNWADGRAFRSRDGLTWEATAIRPFAITSKAMWNGPLIAYRNGWPALGSGMLNLFDGVSIGNIRIVQDHFVDGFDLWTIELGGIYRNGTTVTPAPEGATALCVDGGTVWVGTADSHLWSYGP